MLRHNGTNLHILGSFTTNVGASPYSFLIAVQKSFFKCSSGHRIKYRRIQPAEVEPGRTERGQHFVVQIDNRAGLKISLWIRCIRRHQVLRKACTQQAQDAGQDRRPASMHAKNDDTDRSLLSLYGSGARTSNAWPLVASPINTYPVSRCSGGLDRISIRRARTSTEMAARQKLGTPSHI